MNKENKNEKGMSNKKWKIIIIVIIIFSFAAPFIFTRECSGLPSFMNTGQVGDTIGGLMNPFISIAIVLVTWLAFNEQYKANEMVRKQFERQKFENQFYERLRLHKENVNEMEIEIKYGCIIEKNKTIKGRTAFYKILEKLEQEIKSNDNFNNREEFQKKIYLKFYDKYGRYISHYFRHLYHTVKFVVNEKAIEEEGKRKYLQILRAQMSNDEQKLLFYNWLAPNYGGDWENDTNSFFTQHKMLHNLWHDKLVKNKIIKEKLESLVKEYKKYYRGERGKYILKNYKVQSIKQILKYLKKTYIKKDITIVNKKLKDLLERYKKEKGNLFEIGDDIDKNFS